jgi:hypothetical protein
MKTINSLQRFIKKKEDLMMKKLVFILLFLAVTLFASAVSVDVHIDPNGISCDKIVITVYTGDNYDVFVEDETYLPGQTFHFSVNESDEVTKINVYGKNFLIGSSDTYVINDPYQNNTNHAYLYLPNGIKPPIGEPGISD